MHQRCAVEVVFEPVLNGAKDAEISVTSNNPDDPVVSATIMATGLPVAMTSDSNPTALG